MVARMFSIASRSSRSGSTLNLAMSKNAGVRWEFIGAGDQTWTWCRVDGAIQCASAAFSDFGAALADATTQGFNPVGNYWLVKSQGRATHFRPGKMPVNLPSGMSP